MPAAKKRATLFSRIMFRLTLPLVFLTLVFTAIQLMNQMNAMNEFHKIESRYAFDALQKAVKAEMQKETDYKSPAFRAILKKIEDLQHLASIDLFNVLDHEPVFEGTRDDWSPPDYQAVEQALYQRRLGKNYFVRINKELKKLIAYIPLEIAGNQVYIVRAIYSLAGIKDALEQSKWTLGLMVFFIILTGFFIGHGLAQSIVKPIQELNEATQEIVKGHLGKNVTIRTGDEIEALGETFNRMSAALKEMKERAEDSNPLTQLPGNQGIFHELRKRIMERQKFVLFHTDLDRFKIFNDHYGLARGDEAIKKTAELLKQAGKDKGAPDDFVGHQGGDDFIIITRPQIAKRLAESIIDRFDKDIIRSLYRKEDYEKGYTMELDRRRLAETGEEVMVKFPLLAISLAGISNVKRDFADYFDCMSAAVEIKKEVKKTIQSSYLIKE